MLQFARQAVTPDEIDGRPSKRKLDDMRRDAQAYATEQQGRRTRSQSRRAATNSVAPQEVVEDEQDQDFEPGTLHDSVGFTNAN